MIRFTPFVLVALAVAHLATPAAAQSNRPPAPQVQSSVTKDGVQIKFTYFPSSQAGKETVPVLLLADYKDARSVMEPLARRLQGPAEGDKHKSFAVVTADLRGHGDSVSQTLPNGNKIELDPARFGRNEFAAMVGFDMEAIRRFLVNENDAGKLNLNKLSLVGAGLGASVALNFAAVDWATPPLAARKQGQDVKALVLLSPRWKYRTLSVQDAVRQPGVQRQVAMMLMFGDRDRGVAADARRIFGQFEKFHPVKTGDDPADRDLQLLPAPNDLQGTNFLKEGGRDVESRIIDFLQKHVVAKEHDWVKRLD